MMVTLTQTQERILAAAVNHDTRDDFLVSGLAGTGKTTMLINVVEALKQNGHSVAVAAPTGKAAHVINGKAAGAFTATTVHRLLTESVRSSLTRIHADIDQIEAQVGELEPTPDQKTQLDSLYRELDVAAKKDHLHFAPRSPESLEHDVIVFDEASMIGLEKMYLPFIIPMDAKKFFFGDGGQLPPVKDKPALALDRTPHRLTEILRQQGDSGIIPISHHITKRGEYPALATMQKYSDVTVLTTNRLESIVGYEDHQIIVWQNADRHKINSAMRAAYGFSGPAGAPHLPATGEVIMIDSNDETRRLARGMLATIKHVVQVDMNPYLCMVTSVIDGIERAFEITLTDMVGQTQLIKDKVRDQKMRRYAEMRGIAAQYSYCITCHKAQGSEWKKVFVLDRMGSTRDDWRKWAYTAVTRASEKLVIASHELSNG